uniref:Tetraspanin 37 n=1 Tax=Lates calcarifer TaxID=8187 RepID=A0A4W6E1D9_LATCA
MKYTQNSLYFSNAYIILPAVFALASAAFLLASGCLGSWLSLRDSTCLQGLVRLSECVWMRGSVFGLYIMECFLLQFVYLLVVVFCLEGTASALAYFHSTKLDSEITSLRGVFQNYTGSSQDPNSRTVDATQEELQCCGIHDYSDWLKTSWFNRTGGLFVPHSCCNSTFPSCNGTVDQPWQLYTKVDIKINSVLVKIKTLQHRCLIGPLCFCVFLF